VSGVFGCWVLVAMMFLEQTFVQMRVAAVVMSSAVVALASTSDQEHLAAERPFFY